MVVDVMHAPDCGQLQVLEPVMQYFPPSFGNQSLAPIRFADPIADLARRLRLATLGVDCVRQRRQSDTADWLPVSFRTTAYVSGVLSTLRITRALSSTLACTGHAAAAGPMCGLLAYLNSAFASATSSIFHGRNRSRSVCSSVFKFN